MHISYDYTELLGELKSELLHGNLNINSNIRIVRENTPVFGDYKPILDWYYHDDIINEDNELINVTRAVDEMESVNSII
ncbi:hypothetical protein [Brochothrix thermosphacta]|uniref:Uncharacterized protein n=1 Tax=Brochothrix thermosphacta TaxID=2756 RepID=A0A1D2LTQ3_BROTH|nr:hypothetical protein [Brochothrix thermosphacta]ATF25329.1 hypothetical protein CNY62_02370 [Brochothrix thermosphacta]ODJ73328.1 hypothetical protein BFR39_03130 [Brochothrix thermosphacta]